MHQSIEKMYLFTIVDTSYLNAFSTQDVKMLFGRILNSLVATLVAFVVFAIVAGLVVFVPNIPILGLSTLVVVIIFQAILFIAMINFAFNKHAITAIIPKDISKLRGHPDWPLDKKIENSSNLALYGQQGAFVGLLPNLFMLALTPTFVLLGRSYVESGEFLTFAHFSVAALLDAVTFGVVEVYPPVRDDTSISVGLMSSYTRAALTLTVATIFLKFYRMFPGHHTLVGNVYFAARYVIKHQFLTNFDDPDLFIIVSDVGDLKRSRVFNNKEFADMLSHCYGSLTAVESESRPSVPTVDEVALPRLDRPSG